MTQPLTDQIPAAEPDPLDVIAQASDLATLDEELNQLPQKYRDVLVMSYFAQHTNQEIADQLNESKELSMVEFVMPGGCCESDWCDAAWKSACWHWQLRPCSPRRPQHRQC